MLATYIYSKTIRLVSPNGSGAFLISMLIIAVFTFLSAILATSPCFWVSSPSSNLSSYWIVFLLLFFISTPNFFIENCPKVVKFYLLFSCKATRDISKHPIGKTSHLLHSIQTYSIVSVTLYFNFLRFMCFFLSFPEMLGLVSMPSIYAQKYFYMYIYINIRVCLYVSMYVCNIATSKPFMEKETEYAFR